jgi:hypothetical protein
LRFAVDFFGDGIEVDGLTDFLGELNDALLRAGELI